MNTVSLWCFHCQGEASRLLSASLPLLLLSDTAPPAPLTLLCRSPRPPSHSHVSSDLSILSGLPWLCSSSRSQPPHPALPHEQCVYTRPHTLLPHLQCNAPQLALVPNKLQFLRQGSPPMGPHRLAFLLPEYRPTAVIFIGWMDSPCDLSWDQLSAYPL